MIWPLVLTALTELGAVSSSPAPTQVEVRECGDITQASVQKLLELELRSAGAQRASAPVWVEVRCVGDLASVRVRSGQGQAQREVSVTGTQASARDRLLALVAAELLTEIEEQAQASSPPPPPPPPKTQVPPPRSPPSRDNEVSVAGTVGLRGRSLEWAGGGAVRYDRILFPWLFVEFELGAQFLRSELSLGTMRMWTFGFSPSVFFAHRYAAGRVAAGLGLRTELHSVAGQADDPQSTNTAGFGGVSLSPTLRGRSNWWLAPGWFAALGVDGGIFARPVEVEVDGSSEFSLRGLWGELSFGFGAAF